jgi:hypothetical protein
MTRPAEPDANAGARFVEKLLEGDPAHLDVATDDEVVAMMDAAGIEAGEPEDVETALARGARRAKERSAGAAGGAEARPATRTRKPMSRAAWAAAAVAAAGAAALVATEGGAIVTALRGNPHDIGPDRPGPAPPPEQYASRLRDEAIASCHAGDLETCRAKLDEAKALDPAGETDPRVVQARETLTAAPVPWAPSSADKPDKPPRP